MPRSAGVTITALASAASAALALLFILPVALTLRSGTIDNQPNAEFARIAIGFFMLMTSGLAVWAALTAYGLWKLRGWGRWSVLIYSGCLIAVGAISATGIAFMPVPPTPQTPQGLPAAIRVGLAAFYGCMTLPGVFWLYYFNRASVKAQFDPRLAEGLESAPSARPISIAIIAVFLLLGGFSSFLGVFLPFPAVFPSFIFTGIAARLIFLAFAALYLWTGFSLWRLEPRGRLTAIGLCVYGVLNSLLTVLLPGAEEHLAQMMRAMPWGLGSLAATPQASSMIFGAVFGIACALAALWFLYRNRSAFQPPPPAEPA